MIEILTVRNGDLKQNCYIAYNSENFAVLVDPGGGAKEIVDLITSCFLKPLAILNTHAHYDHIGAVSELANKFQIPFYLHKADYQLLKQANLYRYVFSGKKNVNIPKPTHDLSLFEEDLSLESFNIQVMHTPGHTQGGVSFLFENNLFSGDTLMSNGPGRSDFPGGDKVLLDESVNRLIELPGNTVVWPGHGKSFLISSLIGAEHDGP